MHIRKLYLMYPTEPYWSDWSLLFFSQTKC